MPHYYLEFERAEAPGRDSAMAPALVPQALVLGGSSRVARSIVLAAAVVASFLSASAWGGSVTLAWGPGTNTAVAGYHVYYGGATLTYTNMVAVGDVTNATVSGLVGGAEYFFAATTVDSAGVESLFSNEISFQVPSATAAPATPPMTWPTPADIVYGTALGAGQLNANSSVAGIFTYSPAAGAVLNAGSQVLSVTFNPTDTNDYAAVTTNVALVVLPETLTITAVSASKLYGAALPVLTASYSGFVNGDTAGSLTTAPVLATTATAASPVGTYPITVSGAASPNYTISYASGTLTVLPASASTQSVTLAWAPSTNTDVAGYHVYYGGVTRTYTNMVAVGDVTNATVSGLIAGAEYFFAATTVDSAGVESVFSEEISYQVPGAAAAPATPPMTWPTPADIVYGTALGAGQLDATSSVPGIFSYNPAAGAVLDAGSRVLSVTFNPTDTNNYAAATTNVALVVLPAAAAALVTSSANPSLPGAAVTFTTVLSAVAPGAGIPTGTAQFIIDGAVAGGPAPLSGGTASYTTSTLGHGRHTVAAQYGGDGNFSGTTNFLAGTQVVDTPPVPGAIAITYDAATGTKLSLAALLSSASDADGDPLALASLATASANGGSLTSSAGWIFYVPAPGFTNADTLSYAISDGYCSPVTGTVTLSLRCDNGSSANLTVSVLSNGSYAINGSGVPGRLYQLEFADGGQTANWQSLGQALADPNGSFGLIDPNGSSQRLYRTVCP
jgi:hypothetical protein